MPIWSPAMIFGSATSGYVVENAIMLDGGADYLVRDPSSAGNRKTFTFSCWLKRSNLGTTGGTAGNNIFGGDRGSRFSDRLMFGNGDDGSEYLKASFHDDSNGAVQTNALYRDPTAWMNVVWVVDTDQGGSYTASNTVKIYVNGVSQTFSSASYPAEDYETAINNTENQAIGVRAGDFSNQHFGGYMAEVILLDGTAVSDASSFGELDDNGVWVPVDPSGLTFGTNGFYLDFSLSPARQTGMTASNTGTSFVDFNAANTVDNDPTSKAFRLAHGVTGQQLDLDMGSGNTLNLKQVGMYMDNSGGNGQGATWSVFYSDNGSDYTDTSEDITYTDNGESSSTEVRKALSSNHGAHRYWRLTVSATSVPSEPPSSGAIYGVNLYDAGLGKDASGQNNDFTENSLTVANQVTDTCTDDAASDIGNFATLNPISRFGQSSSTAITLTNGNLTATSGDTNNKSVLSTMSIPTSGKWYFEYTVVNNAASQGIGVRKVWSYQSAGVKGDSNVRMFHQDGEKSNGSGSSYGSAWSNDNVIGCAIDVDNGAIYFAINNTWQASGDPTSGSSKTNAAFTDIVSSGIHWAVGMDISGGSPSGTFNFGATDFAYTPPTGYKALNTANLAAPTVTNPSDFFKTVLYTGNGGDKSVTGVGFQPDFVWIKCRSVATNWNVVDVVRGADAMLRMASSTNTEQSGANQEFESFDADGFTVTHHGGVVEELNRSSATYVAYCMKAGGAASSNGNGSITSQVSAASHGGFSIITYTGDGNAGATIGHGLSKAAEFQIFKRRTPAQDYHVGTNITGSITGYEFNNATASVTAAVTAFNATTTALDSQGVVNDEDDTYVSYAFARTPGLIGIGSYTGNNSADGPYIVIDDGASGFRPAWVMIKRIGSTGNWVIRDAVRNPYNPVNLELYANATDADYTEDPGLDFIANGFKLRDTAGAINASDSYIYLAFADQPFGGDGVSQAKAR